MGENISIAGNFAFTIHYPFQQGSLWWSACPGWIYCHWIRKYAWKCDLRVT